MLSVGSPSTARMGRRQRAVSWAEHVAFAVIAFVPQLLTQPGVVVADTKTYLYIDVGTYLRQSATLWTPSVALGSVTYQQIGYLYPMGPFFWLVHVLQIPVWVGERLWVGALLFTAGSGVLYLCRTVGLDGPGRAVAALAYMLTPYFLQYLGRESELLLPWAGLGWLLALTIRSVRTGGWRYPALFALVWVTISGENATAAMLALLPPALWLLYCVLGSHEHSWRQVWAALWRTTILAGAVSLWWLVALLVEGHYGVNVLIYTESVAVESLTSLSSEIVRGLGYWYFYGQDILGTWQPALTGFTQQPLLVALTFAVPILAVAAAVVVRWRMRGYFVLIVVIAMIVAVGTHPFNAPSVVGGLLKDLLTTKAGNALRSSNRATPTVILGLAMLFGAGITALTRRLRLAGVGAAVLSVGLVAAANPAVWNGTTVPDRYAQPSPLPSYVTRAAKALNTEHTATRVLAIPGQTFAAYRYGTPLDPVWPGVLTRPFVQRQQLPYGSLATFDLLYGLDNPMQNGTSDQAAIAPLARLMSVGDVLVQNDLEYELYDQPNPQQFWKTLTPTPAGLAAPTGYGQPVPNVSLIPKEDDSALASSPDAPWPSPVEVMPVANPRPIVRTESTSGDLVVDGDGVGLDAAAALGLLDTNSPVLYAGTLDTRPKILADAMSGGATLVVTDSNRRQIFTWGTVGNSAGITLTASQSQSQAPLDIFPPTAGSQSEADVNGVGGVTASVVLAQNTPAMAMDGNPDTAWETFEGAGVAGNWWQVKLEHKTTANSITILQPTILGYNYQQWITKASLTFDGRHPIRITLGPASHSGQGQTIHFPSRKFHILTINIDKTNLSGAPIQVRDEASPVGLAEVEVAHAHINDILAMPSDLLTKVGKTSQSHRVLMIMTRDRATPVPPYSDPEPVLARQFTLPTKRTFTLSGQARVSSEASDQQVDSDVGRLTTGGVVAYSSSRLANDVADTASAALDNTSSTVWSPAFGTASQKGAWIQVNLPHPVTVGHLDLQIVADGLHSVPTSIEFQACSQLAADQRCPSAGSEAENVALPTITDGRRQNATVTVPVSFPALTGQYLTFTITGVRLEFTKNYYSKTPQAMPLGIAELGIPGVQVTAPPASMPGDCRSDLVSIDGKGASVEVTGSTQQALAGDALQINPCGPDAGGITLSPGSHVVISTAGQDSGFDIDQLVLDSAPGGASSPAPSASGRLAAPIAGPTPTMRVTSASTTSFHMKVTGATKPFWLVLGESRNAGWNATVDGKVASITPALVDGFANGWLVDPGRTSTISFTLRWTPQTEVTASLLASAAAVAVCVAITLWPNTRRRRRRRTNAAVVVDAPGVRDMAEPSVPATSSVPVLVSPLAVAGTTPIGRALLVAIASGLVSAAIIPTPVVGLAVAATVLLTLILPETRWLLGTIAVALVVGAVAYVVLQSFPVGGWPLHFELANDMVWAALVFLAADVVVDRVPRL